MVTRLIQHGIGDTGLFKWSGGIDKDGYRTYKASYRVMSDIADGPANVLQTPGLPLPGSIWLFLDDVDVWAFCKWTTEATPVVEGEPNTEWVVTKDFSTKPDQRCQDVKQQDPLLEPWKINIDSSRYTEEAILNRFGKPITNSAWEQIRGKEVERDRNRTTVRLEKNVGDFSVVLLALSMRETLNAYSLWGCPPRTIKLSKVSASRHFYGSCLLYFTLSMDFDIDLRGWDKDVNDRASKVLHGHWGVLSGSSCTLNITASTTPTGSPPVTGVITAVTIASGGLGYPANSVISLKVNGGDGRAVVNVVTNNSGVVTGTSGSGILQSTPQASGYTTGVASTVVNTVSWILDNINGQPPNPYDPTHFDVAKDRNGENMKDLLLNGRGLPSGVVVGTGGLFVSIINSNVGKRLSDLTAWVPIAGNPAVAAFAWDATVVYSIGSLVSYQGDTYISIVDNNTGNFAPNTAPNDWVNLGSLNLGTGPVNAGNYSATTTYAKKQYVADSQSSSAGVIHIEFYDESDFLQLSVPADLTYPH